MSEKDIALGGAAATKFASRKGIYEDGDVAYKSSDDVRAHYRKQMENTAQEVAQANNSVLPLRWREREKEKDIIAKQSGLFAAARKGEGESPLPTNCLGPAPPLQGTCTSSAAEVALLQVTTHSLEALASVMENTNSGTSIPNEERAKFAAAIQRAMNALAKCR